MTRFAVIGAGVVGRHMIADIERAGHAAIVYDKFLPDYQVHIRESVNACEAAFVCVPTPQAQDGSCDLSAIDDVFSWLRVPVAVIRSTVPPGTTRGIYDVLTADDNMAVAFCPEFIGEGSGARNYTQMRQPPFLIIGGTRLARERASAAFAHLYSAECELIFTDSTTAEMAKYAENYFLALKVTWANELYGICQRVGVDFDEMMSAVTHDYRIGRSHTHVYPDARGWAGRCLPKDCSALLALVGEDTAPMLAAVRRVNEIHRAKSSK